MTMKTTAVYSSLSDSAEESDKVEAGRLGINLYVRKPSGYVEFVEIVRRIDSLVDGLAST